MAILRYHAIVFSLASNSFLSNCQLESGTRNYKASEYPTVVDSKGWFVAIPIREMN